MVVQELDHPLVQIDDIGRAGEIVPFTPVGQQSGVPVQPVQRAEHGLGRDRVLIALNDQNRRSYPIRCVDRACSDIGGGIGPREFPEPALPGFQPPGRATDPDTIRRIGGRMHGVPKRGRHVRKPCGGDNSLKPIAFGRRQ